MTAITVLTRDKLKTIGLTEKDIIAFLDLRSRYGLLDKELLSRTDIDLIPEIRKKLLELLDSSVSDEFRPTRLALKLEPTPAQLSDTDYKLILSFNRVIDDELYKAERSVHLRGPSDYEFYDISQKHIIHIRVEAKDGILLSERVLVPPYKKRSERDSDSLDEMNWIARPPLNQDEYWQEDGVEIYGELEINTIKRPEIEALDTIPEHRIHREGQYQVVGNSSFRFDAYCLSVAPITQTIFDKISSALESSADMASLLRFNADDENIARILQPLTLIKAELDFDGNFKYDHKQAVKQDYLGWIWALSGPDVIIGFQPDLAILKPQTGLIILIPSSALTNEISSIPFDISEEALLNRPDLFGDDPGTSCKPFDNPGRILGEKRFSSILRVTQPFVARAGYDTIVFDDKTQRPVGYPRREVGPKNPLDYEGDPALYQAQTIALGHIIEQSVRYRSNGYSLGDIAYSMTLAPRQKRKILKLDYSRQERARRDEEIISDDEVSDQVYSDRDYDNAVKSELNEWSRGRSQSDASAGAAGLGFAMGPVVIGGGAVTTSASSSSSQEGGRSAAANETQSLRDSIRRYGESLRSLQSTVVTEVEQSESIKAVSEVVQNINYTRSLSIVYYEILRHLRVDVEVSGVKECLFVPMPIKKFTQDRIFKHRDVLRRYARSRMERLAFRHIEDIQENFVDSSIPSGVRADQRLRTISGSLYIQIGVEIPDAGPAVEEINKNTDKTIYEREIIRIYTASFAPFAPFLPVPVSELIEKTINAASEVRNRYFQKEIAPHMVRRYVDGLTLETGSGKDLQADLTVAGRYKFGSTLRVDFTANVSGVTREDLKDVTVKFDSESKMPKRSFMNVKSARFRYSNNYYRGSARSDYSLRDLIDPETGSSDAEGAKLFMALSARDTLDLQEELKDALKRFTLRVQNQPFRYHKAIWWHMDRDELYTLLDGFSINNEDGRSLASIVNQRPIGILGNMLIFRTSTDIPLDPMFSTFADLKNHYTSALPKSDSMRISLPTDGLYARAHMDDCIAAEEHDGSFDWVFDNTEPELADFPTNIFESRRAQPQNLTPTNLPDTIINLQNAPAAPSVSGLGAAFDAVGNANAFRDMAGLEGTQANARAAMESAAELANNFGNMAFQARLAQLKSDAVAGKNIKSFNAAVKQAVKDDLLSKEKGEEAVAINTKRQAEGGYDKQAKEKADTEREIVNSDGGGVITTADKDGVRQVVKNPKKPKKPDPVAKYSVVPIPPDQILFMNFKTGSPDLKPNHERALEILVGEIGLKMHNVVKIEGHASKSGSEAKNDELAAKRATRLFEFLHKLLNKLRPKVNYTPIYLRNAGEHGSYRNRFKGIKKIREAPGENHRNDPVEKAVLFKFGDKISTDVSPKKVRFFGSVIEITNHIVILKNTLIVALPDGSVSIVDRSTYETTDTLNEGDYIDNSSTVDDSNSVKLRDGNNIRNGVNGIQIVNNTGDITIYKGKGSDTKFTKEVKERIRHKPQTDWIIKLHNPTLVGHRTLKKVLTELASIIAGLSTVAEPFEALAESITTATSADENTDFLIKALKLNGVIDLLDLVAFGTVKVDAQIKVKEDPTVQAKGRFTGPGVVIGSQSSNSVAVIANNVNYKTSKAIEVNNWESQSNFTTFTFLDNGANVNITALAEGLQVLIDDLVPALGLSPFSDTITSGIEAITGVLDKITGASALQFKAFSADTKIKLNRDQVQASGLEFRAIAIAPGKMAFTEN